MELPNLDGVELDAAVYPSHVLLHIATGFGAFAKLFVQQAQAFDLQGQPREGLKCEALTELFVRIGQAAVIELRERGELPSKE